VRFTYEIATAGNSHPIPRRDFLTFVVCCVTYSTRVTCCMHRLREFSFCYGDIWWCNWLKVSPVIRARKLACYEHSIVYRLSWRREMKLLHTMMHRQLKNITFTCSVHSCFYVLHTTIGLALW